MSVILCWNVSLLILTSVQVDDPDNKKSGKEMITERAFLCSFTPVMGRFQRLRCEENGAHCFSFPSKAMANFTLHFSLAEAVLARVFLSWIPIPRSWKEDEE